MQTQHPILPNNSTLQEIVEFLQETVRLRQEEDLPDFTNLTQRFVSGRTTARVPSSFSDVLATDNLGDIVTDAPNGFEYKLVDDAGTFKWDRRTLDIAW